MSKVRLFNTDNLRLQYQQIFKTAPRLFRSPGRINIIGEHTDYNNGFVLPAAIDQAAYVAAGKRNDDTIHIYSVQFDDHYTCAIDTLAPRKSWTDYVLGVVDQLRKKGYPVGGFNLVLDGDVEVGAGLSSSAAVECTVIYALNELYALGIDRMQLVRMAQHAEHEFAGVKCGIMDQFASAFGKKEHVVKLDCRSLEYEYVPLNLEGYKIVLLNTNVKHSLSSSEYNTRREQCEQGVAWVAAHKSGVTSMRDVSMADLDVYVKPKDELIYKRCSYVVEENERLQNACKDLQEGNLQGLGERLFASHNGLSKDYEVSCTELDWLVDFVKKEEAVIGARMMGGGFGGCTINLVREDAVGQLLETVSHLYRVHNQLDLSAYVVQTSDGTSEL